MRNLVQDLKRRQRREEQKRFEPNRSVIPAVIKEIDGATEVAGQPGMVWVAEFNQPESRVAVYNDSVLPVAETPVLVGTDPKPPYRRRIIGLYTGGLVPADQDVALFQVGPHGQNHQIPSESNPGQDPVRVFQPALQPLKTTGNSSNLTVTTQSYIYHRNGVRRVFAGQTTNLTSAVPGSGLVRRVLVYLDAATNTLKTSSGSTVVNNGVIPIPYPTIPENGIPSAYVKLANGQTAVTTASHVDDARDFLRGRSLDSGYVAAQVGQVLYSTDGITFSAQLPLVNENGWMLNDEGTLLVVG